MTLPKPQLEEWKRLADDSEYELEPWIKSVREAVPALIAEVERLKFFAKRCDECFDEHCPCMHGIVMCAACEVGDD